MIYFDMTSEDTRVIAELLQPPLVSDIPCEHEWFCVMIDAMSGKRGNCSLTVAEFDAMVSLMIVGDTHPHADILYKTLENSKSFNLLDDVLRPIP